MDCDPDPVRDKVWYVVCETGSMVFFSDTSDTEAGVGEAGGGGKGLLRSDDGVSWLECDVSSFGGIRVGCTESRGGDASNSANDTVCGSFFARSFPRW